MHELNEVMRLSSFSSQPLERINQFPFDFYNIIYMTSRRKPLQKIFYVALIQKSLLLLVDARL